MHETMRIPDLAPPAVHELTDEELESASGGTKITTQFSFPGIVFRFGTDNNGNFFGSAVTDTRRVSAMDPFNH